MDPVSIVSLTTTAFCVVDRLAKTLNFLLHLSHKFKYADVKITLLIGYLGSLNSAVSEIAIIVKGLSGHIQYQKLAQSLDTTLECTKLSLTFLDSKLEGLHSASGDGRTLMDKVSFMLRDADFEEYVSGISTYVNALNLLLNALQSRSLLEQKGILDDPEAESIMVAMADETSSLVCIADNGSMVSKRSAGTETSATLDVTFDFDPEILSSKIYAVTYRSHLRKAISSGKQGDSTALAENLQRKETSDDNGSMSTVVRSFRGATETEVRYVEPMAGDNDNLSGIKVTEEVTQSVEIIPKYKTNKLPEYDPNLDSKDGKDDKVSPRASLTDYPPSLFEHRTGSIQGAESFLKPPEAAEPTLLLLGAADSGKSTLLNSMKLILEGAYTDEQRAKFICPIVSNLLTGVQEICEAMVSRGIDLGSDCNEEHVVTIFMQPSLLESLEPEVHIAIAKLATDTGFQECLQYYQHDSICFYLKSLDRIAAPEYLPSDRDILMSRLGTVGIWERKFPEIPVPNHEPMTLRVFDVGGARSERKKWRKCFEQANIVIFTVDISSYDRAIVEDTSTNRMAEQLTLFDAIVNSRWFSHTEIILCFTKQAKLAAKLQTSPIQQYFPDCEAGDPPNPAQVTQYFLQRFVSLNKFGTRGLRTMVMWDLPTIYDWKLIEKYARDVYKRMLGKGEPTDLPWQWSSPKAWRSQTKPLPLRPFQAGSPLPYRSKVQSSS